MTFFRIGWLVTLMAGLHLVVLAGEPTARRELFNGRDLSGWETWLDTPAPTSVVPGVERDPQGRYLKPLGLNHDPLKVFSVGEADGLPAIHITGEGFGTLTTLDSFSNYHLTLRFKWGRRRQGPPDKARNGGVLYHAHGSHGDVGGRWMHNHQYQVEEGGIGDYVGVGAVRIDAPVRAQADGAKRIFDPAGENFSFNGAVRAEARCGRAAGMEASAGQWNTLEIYASGNEVVHVLNGEVTVRLSASRKASGESLHEGRIALQLEGAEMFFRDIVIEPLAAMPHFSSGQTPSSK